MRMLSFKYVLGFGAASLLMLSACATQTGRPNGGPGGGQGGDQGRGGPQVSGVFSTPVALLFSSMDSNGDAMITQTELASGTNTEWASFPASNNIGAIYFSEWSKRALGSMDANPTFLSFDKNFNSIVTKAEFAERLSLEFERLDKDGDRALTRSEMIFLIDAPMGQVGGGSEGGRGGGQNGGMGGMSG